MNRLPALTTFQPPALSEAISAAGERASYRFVEFFTARIRNPHTRRSYARAVMDFVAWLEANRLRIDAVNSHHVAT